MQVKAGTLVAVCLILGVLIGSASACDNGYNYYKCHHGAVLLGYEVKNGRCSDPIPYLRFPSACNGCTITAGYNSGSITVTVPNEGPITCYYGNPLQTKACVAYCLTSSGGIVPGTYECYAASSFRNTCSCTNVCNRFNG